MKGGAGLPGDDPLQAIAKVVARMTAIERSLPSEDGVARCNGRQGLVGLHVDDAGRRSGSDLEARPDLTCAAAHDSVTRMDTTGSEVLLRHLPGLRGLANAFVP